MLRARVRTKSRRSKVVVCVRQVRATASSYAENYVALEGGEKVGRRLIKLSWGALLVLPLVLCSFFRSSVACTHRISRRRDL